MKTFPKIRYLLPVLLLCALCTAGCGGGGGGGSSPGSAGASGDSFEALASHRDTVTQIRLPVADGVRTASGADGTTVLDYSHTEDGYICIRCEADTDQVQIQIVNPDGSTYPYPLEMNRTEAFPLSGGSGSYLVTVLTHMGSGMYAAVLTQSFDAQITDEFSPYLYPNQYVDYDENSEAVKLGMQISDASEDDLTFISKVYSYVTSHITYDKELAANAPVNYIPDIDATLASGRGICFDYASVMTAMLRSQNIPTRLEVGYAGTAYHAWISVWLSESGWIENIISFDGSSWTLVDPTLGAGNNAAEVKEYIGDGSNYNVKYHY